MDDLWRPQDYDDEPRSNGNFGLDPYRQACQAAEDARLQSRQQSSPQNEAVSPAAEKSEARWAGTFEILDKAGVTDDFLTPSDRAQGPLQNTPELDPASR